jgi:hypothetical protein
VSLLIKEHSPEGESKIEIVNDQKNTDQDGQDLRPPIFPDFDSHMNVVLSMNALNT